MRPYLYYDQAVSLCEHCLRRVEARLVIRDDRVWMLKWCPVHGRAKVLIASDAAFWREGRERWLKPPEMPRRFNTAMRWGCPYDCGLCPDHMQHSCLTLVEITEHCNLRCPVCFAESGPERQRHLDLPTIERMLDAVVTNEGEPDVVQISGGEPTLHPEFFAVLDAARRRPIRHLMVNTNGLRIATEPGFAEQLAAYQPGFEVYLQFDSLRREALLALRGADLRAQHERALARLNELDLSTTLVMTVARGVNDDEVGAVVEYAARQPCVRGVTLQPVQFAGRVDHLDGVRQRLTLTEVRQRLLGQGGPFAAADVVPVPCNPDALAMAYGLKTAAGVLPLTRLVEPADLLDGARNTIAFEADPGLQRRLFELFATNLDPAAQAERLGALLCCLPRVRMPAGLGYRDVFRVVIMAFMDAASFDLRAMKKSCVHIVRPDGRIIPFEAFNLLYRGGREELLAQRRREAELAFGDGTPPMAGAPPDSGPGDGWD